MMTAMFIYDKKLSYVHSAQSKTMGHNMYILFKDYILLVKEKTSLLVKQMPRSGTV